jgi:ApbE superfamily uncharacterized protein (UPF0280 family)
VRLESFPGQKYLNPTVPMPTVPHQKRFYRNLFQNVDLTAFRVIVKETDLWIHAESELAAVAKERVMRCRGYIETFIERYPEFARTLGPWHTAAPVPDIIAQMMSAGRKAGVGPMAAVAGAIAEAVTRDLLEHSGQVIAENGGDIFLSTHHSLVMGIYAGSSPLSMKVGLKIDRRLQPVGVCTSSGTIGHSQSWGCADAVCVVSHNCALADAVATAAGNRVRSKSDIETAIAFGKNISGIQGLVVIIGDRIGLWGDIELVPLKRKKG